MLKYHEFLAENVERSKAIIAQRMRDYEALKARLTRDNTLGYLGKLTELLFRDEPVAEITAVYDRLLALRRANVRINIDEMRTLEQILDALEEKEREARVKKVLSQLPPAQKQWFAGDKMARSDMRLLDGMSKVDISPFMRKVSQYRDKGTMLRMAEVFMRTAAGPADRAHFRGLAGKGLRVVHEDARVIIFHTAKVGDLLKVGGDTAWCIKNPSSFLSYTRDGKTQYVLVDFDRDRWDPLFKVGFTLTPGGTITNAHDVLDKTCKPYLADLLRALGVDPSALASESRKSVGPPPDMATADPTSIIKWLESHGASAGEAPALLRSFVGRPAMPRLLDNGTTRKVLMFLFRSIANGGYVRPEEINSLLPRNATQRTREKITEILRQGDILMPNLDKVDITNIVDPRMWPLLHLVTHDVFLGRPRLPILTLVQSLLRILHEARHHVRDFPVLADEMLRLVRLTDEPTRQVLLAAWEKAVNGVTPDLEEISANVRALQPGDSPLWLQYNTLNILDLLGVPRPFDEESYLVNYWQDKSLILTPPEVTVTQYDHRYFNQMVKWLKDRGVRVRIRLEQGKVLSELSDTAVWDRGNVAYRSHRSRYSKGAMPEILGAPEIRERITRTRQKRFDWRPGTEFPITFVWQSTPCAVEESGESG